MKVLPLLDWIFAVAVAALPAFYTFFARRQDFARDPELKIATIVWAALVLLFAIYTRIRHGRAIVKWSNSYGQTANAIGGQIEGITRLIYATEVPHAIQPQIREVLSQLLMQTCTVVERLAPSPTAAEFCAALLIPEAAGRPLRAVLYTQHCPNASYAPVSVDTPGAAQAFREMDLQAIEDTSDPCWDGCFTNPRYRSFVAFPIVVGGRVGRCLGCVTVDCSEPWVLRERLARGSLSDAVRPQVEAIGLALLYAEVNDQPVQ